MALLKENLDKTLSMDAEMFPCIVKAKLITSHKLENGDSTSTEIPLLAEKIIGSLGYFTAEQRATIYDKIRTYENNKGSKQATDPRGGGGKLLAHVLQIQRSKESLLLHIDAIKEILSPKPISRTTLADAEDRAIKQAIESAKKGLATLSKDMLRGLAEALLGDVQHEYTVEELPMVLATKQVTGKVLEVGKVS